MLPEDSRSPPPARLLSDTCADAAALEPDLQRMAAHLRQRLAQRPRGPAPYWTAVAALREEAWTEPTGGAAQDHETDPNRPITVSRALEPLHRAEEAWINGVEAAVPWNAWMGLWRAAQAHGPRAEVVFAAALQADREGAVLDVDLHASPRGLGAVMTRLVRGLPIDGTSRLADCDGVADLASQRTLTAVERRVLAHLLLQSETLEVLTPSAGRDRTGPAAAHPLVRAHGGLLLEDILHQARASVEQSPHRRDTALWIVLGLAGLGAALNAGGALDDAGADRLWGTVQTLAAAVDAMDLCPGGRSVRAECAGLLGAVRGRSDRRALRKTVVCPPTAGRAPGRRM